MAVTVDVIKSVAGLYKHMQDGRLSLTRCKTQVYSWQAWPGATLTSMASARWRRKSCSATDSISRIAKWGWETWRSPLWRGRRMASACTWRTARGLCWRAAPSPAPRPPRTWRPILPPVTLRLPSPASIRLCKSKAAQYLLPGSTLEGWLSREVPWWRWAIQGSRGRSTQQSGATGRGPGAVWAGAVSSSAEAMELYTAPTVVCWRQPWWKRKETCFFLYFFFIFFFSRKETHEGAESLCCTAGAEPFWIRVDLMETSGVASAAGGVAARPSPTARLTQMDRLLPIAYLLSSDWSSLHYDEQPNARVS